MHILMVTIYLQLKFDQYLKRCVMHLKTKIMKIQVMYLYTIKINLFMDIKPSPKKFFQMSIKPVHFLLNFYQMAKKYLQIQVIMRCKSSIK